jgi:hypothetical protein
MPRQYGTKPARLLRRTGNHVRLDLGDEAALRQLGRSYLDRPLYPIIVNPDLEINDGNRRHAGVMLIDPAAEVPVCVTEEPFTPSTQLEIQVESAAHTKGLSDFEQYLAIDGWLTLNPTGAAKQFAGRVRLDESIVSKIMSLNRCIDAVKDAARAGRIGYTKWHQIARLPQEEQPAALAAALDGATRADLQRRIRHGGNGRAATVKASSIPVMLTNGIAVTFKAEGITLSMALEALADLKQELKEAIDFDHDARTFAVLMKKRARQLAKKG